MISEESGKMNISLVVRDLNIKGGTQKQVLRLAQFLKSKGHNVEIITYNYYPYDFYKGVEDIKVNYLRLGKTSNERKGYLAILFSGVIFKLLRLINRQTDVVNIHDLGLEVLLLIPFIKLFRPKAKIVWQVNDLPYTFGEGVAKVKRNRQNKFKFIIAKIFYRFISLLVDEITVNVTKNKILVGKYFGKNARVIYCGVDIMCDKFPERKITNKIKLISTGVFFPYRNYESILRAMKILKDNGVNCTLSIVGSTSLDSEYADSIKSLAEDLDLEVNILGEISENELREIYLKSHLFLFLNIEQSWGLAIFEAMSCGLPVIISESVGAVEILKGAKGVVILDPFNIEAIAEEIRKFLDKDYYLEMSYQAFLASREMSWDLMYSSKVETLFYNLLSKDLKIGVKDERTKGT